LTHVNWNFLGTSDSIFRVEEYVPRRNTSLFLLNKKYIVAILMKIRNSDTIAGNRTATVQPTTDSPISRLQIINMMTEKRLTGGDYGKLERKNIGKSFRQEM
jgi:hypothetical protein